MAAIKVTEGSKIKVKSTGRFGTVINLTPQKTPGRRGRPPTVAHVILDDATEAAYGVRELQLI